MKTNPGHIMLHTIHPFMTENVTIYLQCWSDLWLCWNRIRFFIFFAFVPSSAYPLSQIPLGNFSSHTSYWWYSVNTDICGENAGDQVQQLPFFPVELSEYYPRYQRILWNTIQKWKGCIIFLVFLFFMSIFAAISLQEYS